jgi:hypothetical protein
MKLTFSAALLALLVATPAFALQEPDKDKPQQEEPKKEEPKKEDPKKQEPDRQQPQEKEKQQQDKAQADKAKQTDKQQQIEKAKPDKPTPEHAQQAQGGGNGGRTIKETDFRAHFGREHTFRVARRDDRRFNYGGYWFVYNNPWPVGWSYSDEVYVDEIDGQYYLIDPVHPGIQLLIVVSD